MSKKSIKTNYIYNLLLTGLNLLFPLITSPYISKVLGATNIGKVNYAFAIANWFVLIASFGIPTYGIREIAKTRNNKKEMSNVFWDLIFFKVIISTIVLIIYVVMIFTVPKLYDEIGLFLIMIILIVLNVFQIEWFFQGIEEYKFITIRSIIVKVFSLIMIMLLVKNKQDYIVYALITIIGVAFSNLLNYRYSKKYVKYYKHKVDFKRHLPFLKIFFISSLVISVYKQMDQIILGSYAQPFELAYYTRSRNITNIGLQITIALTTVLVPKAAYLFENDYKEYKKLICNSINYIYIIAVPCTVGIALLSKEVMFFFGGNEFVNGRYSLMILSLLVIFISIGTWQYNQILIPAGEEKIGLRLQTMSACISLLLNFIIVPQMGYIGTSIVIVFIEAFGTFIGGMLIKRWHKDIKIKYLSKTLFKSIVASSIMSIVVIFIKDTMKGNNIILFSSIVCGAFCYGIMLIILREKIVLKLINQIYRR